MNICLFADAQSIHIRQLAHHLAKRGHRLHVVTHKPALLNSATVERFAVPEPGLLNLRGWSARQRKYVQRFFQEFDIVNVHFLADWPLIDVLRDRRPSDARFVATAWGSDIVDPPDETPAPSTLRQYRIDLLKAADAITACGPSFASTVAGFAELPLESMTVVPFGVDTSLFFPAGRSLSDSLCVGFFKGFRAVYGPTVLIRALPEILRSFPSVRFELIGDGAELTRCRDLSRELGVSSAINWIGRLAHDELPARIRRWALSVVPSIHEAFGVAALESQATAVPVVASAIRGLHDTVRHGESGLHFPVGDSKALAAAVVSLLRDAELRKRFADRGEQWVAERYSWPGIAAHWESLYSKTREQSCVMV